MNFEKSTHFEYFFQSSRTALSSDLHACTTIVLAVGTVVVESSTHAPKTAAMAETVICPAEHLEVKNSRFEILQIALICIQIDINDSYNGVIDSEHSQQLL